MSRTTAAERTLIAKVAAHSSWARTPDRSARTAKARAALLERFEREVDPDNRLAPDERALRAENARKAYFSRLALQSARARRRSKDFEAEAAAAETELSDLGGGDLG